MMPPEMFFGGSAYYFATLKKYNTVQKKPPDPNWNKEIFSGIFLKLEWEKS